MKNKPAAKDIPRRAGPRRTRIRKGAVGSEANVPWSGNEPTGDRSLNSFLVNKLGGEIIGGLYPPGTLLPAALEICARFSVSRTALREAYSVLTAKGLIVSRPNVGTRVRPKINWNMLDPEILAWHLQTVPAENYVADLYTLRQVIEPEAAALAAAGRSEAMLERLSTAYADMERFKDGAGDLIGADLRFHLAILEADGNPFIAALGSLIQAALLSTFKLSWEGAARIQNDRLRQHRAIYEAIRDGRPQQARERMASLLRDSIEDVRKYLREADELPNPGG